MLQQLGPYEKQACWTNTERDEAGSIFEASDTSVWDYYCSLLYKPEH